VYRTLFGVAGFFWGCAAAGLSAVHFTREDENFWLATAVTASIIAALLYIALVLIRLIEQATVPVIGMLGRELTRARGDGAPTGPMPAAALHAVPRRETA
jgi:hypothetical protein